MAARSASSAPRVKSRCTLYVLYLQQRGGPYAETAVAASVIAGCVSRSLPISLNRCQCGRGPPGYSSTQQGAAVAGTARVSAGHQETRLCNHWHHRRIGVAAVSPATRTPLCRQAGGSGWCVWWAVHGFARHAMHAVVQGDVHCPGIHELPEHQLQELALVRPGRRGARTSGISRPLSAVTRTGKLCGTAAAAGHAWEFTAESRVFKKWRAGREARSGRTRGCRSAVH